MHSCELVPARNPHFGGQAASGNAGRCHGQRPAASRATLPKMARMPVSCLGEIRSL